MYEDIQSNETKKTLKESKKNKNQEAPGYGNRIFCGNEFMSTARTYMAMTINNQYHQGIRLEGVFP